MDHREYFIDQGLDLDELCCWTEEQIDNLPLKLGPRQKLVRGLSEYKKRKKSTDIDIKINGLIENQIDDEYIEELRRSLSQVPFINYDQLEFLDKIGQGAFGTVWKGYIKKKNDDDFGLEVAIKKLTSHTPKESLEDFKKEVTILHSIAHPNIIKLFGVALKPSLTLVMEYCALGTLHHVISNKKNKIGWPQFFSLIRQSLLGVQALHSHNPKILHRDIKPHNLLLTKDWQVKVADFGLSLETNARTDVLIQAQGTSAYMAPELCHSIKYSTKSDVFSLGIVIWEILYRVIYQEHQRPYAEFEKYSGPNSDLLLIVSVSNDGLRPTIPEKSPELITKLVQKCIVANPAERPECDQILGDIDEAFKNCEENTAQWEAMIRT